MLNLRCEYPLTLRIYLASLSGLIQCDFVHAASLLFNNEYAALPTRKTHLCAYPEVQVIILKNSQEARLRPISSNGEILLSTI